MKKLNYLAATLFAATLLATPACHKDDDIIEPLIEKDTDTIIIGPPPIKNFPGYAFYESQNSKFDTYPSECTEIGKSEEWMACHNSGGLYTANPGAIATSLYKRDGDIITLRIHKPDNTPLKYDGTAGISIGLPNSTKEVVSVPYKAGDLFVELSFTINGKGEFGKDQSQPGYLHGYATYYPFTKGEDGSIYYSEPLKVWSKDALYKINSYKSGEVMMYCNGVEVRCSGPNNNVNPNNGSTSEWCTKLPCRYYNELFGYNIIHYKNAQDWATDYTNFPSDLFDRIENINYNVRPNDIIVYFKDDGFGHIGIVMEVYQDKIKVVEQNGQTVIRELNYNNNGSVVWGLAHKIIFIRPRSLFGNEVKPHLPPSITQCAINEEDIAKGDSREFTEGDDIKIVAWSNSNGKFTISVDGKDHNEPNYTIENAQPGEYPVSVWIEADGKKSDEYKFTINVKEKEGQGEVEIPAITECTINGQGIIRNACNIINYNEDGEYSFNISTNGNYKTKIYLKETKYAYPTNTSFTLNPGDYSISIWNELDDRKSETFNFDITIKPPVSVQIESNIPFGTEFPSVSENSFIYIKYNGEKIRLQGDEGCELSVKAVYEGNTIKFIAAKSFRQDGVAVLYENGFTTKVDSKSYHQYDTEVIFEIDPKNITDKTEYRIALVTDCNDNGYQYKAGYYTAPLVLNSVGNDANRSYSVSPSTGRFLTDIASNNLKTIKASNNKPSYLVDGNAGCDTKIKVQSVNGNTVTLLCTKDGGFRVPGRMIVYEGSSPEQLWYGNIFAEKSYRGNNTQDEVTLKLDVSHITSSTKFGVVILSDEGDGNGTMYGYYTGTITVTPR